MSRVIRSLLQNRKSCLSPFHSYFFMRGYCNMLLYFALIFIFYVKFWYIVVLVMYILVWCVVLSRVYCLLLNFALDFVSSWVFDLNTWACSLCLEAVCMCKYIFWPLFYYLIFCVSCFQIFFLVWVRTRDLSPDWAKKCLCLMFEVFRFRDYSNLD